MSKSHVEVSRDSYTETLYKQAEKGMEKYGQSMDPLESGRDWLTMAEEEQVDGHQYLVAEKVKRKFIVSKIRKLLNYENVDKTEVSFWLDELEGK